MCLTQRYGSSALECLSKFPENASSLPAYCPPSWDTLLCWPHTPAGEISSLPCPAKSGIPGIHKSNSAYRTCGEDAVWVGKGINGSKGWTNYSQCFHPNLGKIASTINDTEYITRISEGARLMEMFGLALSMVTLLMSLLIFCQFRNLWNNRTRIHQNLFIAMGIQVAVRFIVYSDQYVVRSPNAYPVTSGIDNTEYICEFFYALLEYARTSMFLWMFVEGMYLHNMITVAVFQEQLGFIFYYFVGWGSPLILTVIWAIITYDKFGDYICWWGYNLSSYYWILEGPRLTVISLNLLFLLNIIRVLVTKLRESNSTEAQQVRKAVRAAIVLLPLLGITNSIQMLYSPIHHKGMFAIWSYLTAFLTSFQGFFCALIYCFLNGEVQTSVSRFLKARKSRKGMSRRRSTPVGVSICVDQNAKKETKEKENNRYKPRENNLNGRGVLCKDDPFYENWSDVELSSHNHVDIEQIEIPLEYLTRHSQNQCAVHQGTTTKVENPVLAESPQDTCP